MNKELQDLAWSVLPKVFKEEVKKLYSRFLFTREGYYDELFGEHNLTSDAEGEEMLTVTRKKVQDMYAEIINDIRDYNGENPEMVGTTDPILRERAAGMKAQLHRLFGSKCLPDNVDSLSQNPPENCDNANHISTDDNKPAEPKFKMGDKVVIIANCKHQGEVAEIIYVDDDMAASYKLDIYDDGKWYTDADLEPYTEPDTSHEMPVCENQSDNTSQKEANMNSNRNLSQETENCDKQLDTILKDNFRNERRLNIAATITAGVMANPNIIKSRNDLKAISDEWLASRTLELVDALIAECEKGGKSWS